MADTKPKLIEYAGTSGGRDITRGFVGAIHKYLPSQDSLLEQKSGGDLELYELVAQDDQVKSCLQQRFRALLAKDWEVIPGGEKRIDKQAAEHLEKQLEAINWDAINEKMLFGIHYGYSAAEILWERQDDKVGIAAIKVRNRRRFHFNADQQLVLKTMQNPLGEDLPERKFWHFCTGADHDDEPYGRGLGHWLYWPTFFKRNGVRWWLKFVEKYAQPTRLGKYPAGATQGEKDTLWDALGSFGDDARSMIPEGLEMEFLESSRAGTVDYKSLCDQMDGAIAKIILSQTMTTDNGSSKSQAEVHEGVKDEVIESDSDLLCESFNNSVAIWLTDWNYPGAAYPKVRRKIQADPDPATMADTDTKLQGLGISLKPEAIAAKYGEDYLIPDNADQIPQLNSEQVNALVGIVTNAKQGGWSAELVAGMINGAFPNWPDKAVAAITKNLGQDVPQDKGAAIPVEPVDLDAVAAQFAAGVPKKQKNCVKGIPCKGQCIAASKTCRQPLTDAQKQKKQTIVAAAGVKPKKAQTQPSEATAPELPTKSKSKVKPVQGDPVKTNQKNLDAARKSIVDATSEEAVKTAEAAASDILNSEDTGVFVRVGSNQTLAAIIGDRFKNSVELGGDADVPGLTEPYQDARKRVEREQMGYADDSDPTKRPIYAYMGNSKNLQSASHEDVAAFGDITIKLRDDVKRRATFTGADSFKSGIASKVGLPSAASLIQSRQHGKPIKIDDVADTIDQLGKAKNIDELMSATSGKGNRYMEAQIHGQVKPSDIGEIHFNGKGEPPIPSKEIRDWAAKNNVQLFKDGKPYEHVDVSDARRKEIAKQMTPEIFKDYVKQKAKRIEQDNPNAVHNMSYDEFVASTTRTINSKRIADSAAEARQIKQEIISSTRKDKFAKYLETAANKGYYVPDRVIDSIPAKGNGGKVSPATISNIRGMSKLNKDETESKSQLHKEMDAILDSPILSDAERASHKPMMSEKEANAYVKGGAFGDHTFYHGSSSEGAVKSITEKGVKISANTTGLYGGGFYMGAGSDVADSFASGNGGKVISLKVKMKNPYVAANTTDALMRDLDGLSGSALGKAFGNRFGHDSMSAVPTYLRLKGHDGIFMKQGGYAIGFEREQMVSVGEREGKGQEYLMTNGIKDNDDPKVKALVSKLKNT